MSVYSNNSLVEYFVSERDAAKDTSTESAIFSIKVTEKLHKINWGNINGSLKKSLQNNLI